MALVLLLVFHSRLRLLPLAIALAAAALTFGLLDLFGGSLTIASIATLPILIGLVVDYAIQLQARFDEAICQRCEPSRCSSLGGGACGLDDCHRLPRDRRGLPRASALADSDGPRIRRAPHPGDRHRSRPGVTCRVRRAEPAARDGRRGCPGCARVWVFRTDRLASRSCAPGEKQEPAASGHPLLPSERLVGLALSHPRRVLAIGGVLAVIGWGVGTQIDTVSDVQSLGPQGLREIKDLEKVQDATGVAGQLEVAVEAPDLSDPATIRWMADFKQRVLEENGFSGARPSCLKAEICPGPALSDFLVSGKRKEQLKRSEIRATLRELPPYDLEQLAPVNAKTGLPGHIALLSFGIRSQSLQGQQAVISRVRDAVGEPGSPGGPPAGVEGSLRRAAGDHRGGGVGSLQQSLLVDAGWARRGGACAACRLPLVRSGAGAAGPGRARDRLVLARALAHSDPAQPDVGGAGGADDRDRD